MKRIYKDRFDKKIGGVCGGLAQYFQFDSSIIRLICILLIFFTWGIFIIIYLLMLMIFPLGPRSYVEANYKRLYRSIKNRKISGVCGGLATYLTIDPNIVRIVVVLLTIVTGFFPIIIVYCVGSVIIPNEINLKKR